MLDRSKQLTQEQAKEYLFKRGYIDLGIGSYHRWIFKPWHEYFVKKQFVVRNAYGQFVPTKENLIEFSAWSYLYDALKDALDGRKLLTPAQARQIREAGLFPLRSSRTLVEDEAL